MRRILFALSLAATMPLYAAGVEVGGQHVIAIPTAETETLDIATSRGFGVSAEVFWTDAISTRLGATFINPEAILRPASPPPDDVDLGTLGADIYAATARLHWLRGSKWSAFGGAGGALVILGNLDDQFGDAVEVEFDPQWTFAGEIGLRYRFRKHVTLETTATWLPLEARSNVNKADDPRAPVPSSVTVDPLVVSVGAAWRF